MLASRGGDAGKDTGMLKRIEAEIAKYLELRWDLLERDGKAPSCGKSTYIKRNTPYVRVNIRYDAAYLRKRYFKIGLGEENNNE